MPLEGATSVPQTNRARAAARSRRWRSRVIAYSASAARSAAATEPWVGTTQAVGQRVTPLARMYSEITASKSWSETICTILSLTVGEPPYRLRHWMEGCLKLSRGPHPLQLGYIDCGDLLTAARPKRMSRPPPRSPPKGRATTTMRASRKLLWSGRRRRRVAICRFAAVRGEHSHH